MRSREKAMLKMLAAGSVLLGALVLVGGCSVEDEVLRIEANRMLEGSVGSTCAPSENFYLGHGEFEVTQDWPTTGDPNAALPTQLTLPRTYTAYFEIVTSLQDNEVRAEGTSGGGVNSQGQSFQNYGQPSTNEIQLEEVQLTYDFGVNPNVAPPADFPGQRTVPLSGKLDGETALLASVELISPELGDLLSTAYDGLPEVLAPNYYPMNVQVVLRGRTLSGGRVESGPFIYPLHLCDHCVDRWVTDYNPHSVVCRPCYPYSQDRGCDPSRDLSGP